MKYSTIGVQKQFVISVENYLFLQFLLDNINDLHIGARTEICFEADGFIIKLLLTEQSLLFHFYVVQTILFFPFIYFCNLSVIEIQVQQIVTTVIK